MATVTPHDKPEPVSISPLLQRLAYPAAGEIQVAAEEIAAAFALIFEDRISVIQTAAFLTLLHSTGKDRESSVIAKCSHRMREAASKIEKSALKSVVNARGRREGLYKGGLVSSFEDELFDCV
jgi:anthranilate phosphoribosyltransferase